MRRVINLLGELGPVQGHGGGSGDIDHRSIHRGEEPESIPVRPGRQGHGDELGAPPLGRPKLLYQMVAAIHLERDKIANMSPKNRHRLVRSNDRSGNVVIQDQVLQLVDLPLVYRDGISRTPRTGSRVGRGKDNGKVGAILGSHHVEFTAQEGAIGDPLVVIGLNDIFGPQSLHRQP